MAHNIGGPKDTKIVDVQLLRALAILLVLFAHLSISQSILMQFPIAVTNPGWIGVELFFVVSGFVVARSLLRGGFDVAAFVVRRVYRLFPIFFVFLGACFVVTAFCRWLVPAAPEVFAPSPGLLTAQTGSILLWNFPHREYGVSYVNMAVWSLMVEFRFYAAIAVALAILRLAFLPASLFRMVLLVGFATAYAVGVIARVLVHFDISFPGTDLLIGKMYDFLALGMVAELAPDRVFERIGSWVRPHIYWLTAAGILITMGLGEPHGRPPAETRVVARLRDDSGWMALRFGGDCLGAERH